MSCIDGFIKEGCWSVLACAIALAENWDLRRYLARAMLALLYVATALGVVYTGHRADRGGGSGRGGGGAHSDPFERRT